MTTRRDPDIMAIDHALNALKRSTPRMLWHNLDFVMFCLQRWAEKQKATP